MTLPNILTLLRIALIPVLFGVFWLPYSWVNPAACLIFATAAITDWFDGYLARQLDQHSNFGEFLDPVADKLMVVVALILIVTDNPGIWVTIAAAVIIGREIVISALREWMAEIGQRATVKVSILGKLKTTFQMFAIALLLWKYPLYGVSIYLIGFVLLQVAALLTLVSMLIYLKAAWPHIRPESSSGA